MRKSTMSNIALVLLVMAGFSYILSFVMIVTENTEYFYITIMGAFTMFFAGAMLMVKIARVMKRGR